MKRFFLLWLPAILVSQLRAQNVGIGTTTPHASALLHVDIGNDFTKGLLITGKFDYSATVPDLGVGTRMMFYPGKAAFRAGHVVGGEWNNSNTGLYSVAMGFGTIAKGNLSCAIGDYANASGAASVALGENTVASGFAATATGMFTTASGDASTAMGSYVSTNGMAGSFLIGDNDPAGTGTTYAGGVNNQFVARFYNGYYLMTSDNNVRTGVYMLHGANAWSSISDVRLKENFLSVNGEDFLEKIAAMNLTTWNYKRQDAKTFRHYGPMAQDFFAAFGHDALGTIGCDTLINQQDFLGVNLIAIQALEKRTALLKEDNELLKKENETLTNQLALQQKEIALLQQQVAALQQKR